MEKKERLRLKRFLNDNIPFKELKKAGFFSSEVKATDYEAQAYRICKHYGLRNIYEFASIGKGTRYHITSDDDEPLPLFARTLKDNFGESITNIIEIEFPPAPSSDKH